jgi:tRNA/rRNA methyltransferase
MQNSIYVILVQPQSPENIGLIARNMKNTGFKHLRIVKPAKVTEKSYVVAVHSKEILENARFFDNLEDAVSDLGVIFASTSKKRSNFTLIPFSKAVEIIYSYPPSTKIGLLFGNERTGLTSEEIKHSNYLFYIPQIGKKPSYNLASAVLLTLFHIFSYKFQIPGEIIDKPISRKEQEKMIELIISKLEEKGVIHSTNKRHIGEMIHDIFGKAYLTERNKRLLLSIFSKGIDSKTRL